MATQRSPLAKRHSWRSLSEVEPSIDVVDYLGCTITLRNEVTARGSVRWSYTVVAPAIGTAWSCDEWPDASDPRHLLELAKCEIDFALEVDY